MPAACPTTPLALPTWSEDAGDPRICTTPTRLYEQALALGPYHHLLPLPLRRRAIVEQFDPPRFLAAMARLRPIAAPEALADDLIALVTGMKLSGSRAVRDNDGQ